MCAHLSSVILIISVCTSIRASTIEVCPSCHFSTIGRAIDKASKGDTILVKGSKYQEATLIISKPLILLGIDYPVLDGSGDNEIINIHSDGVVISGFIFQNVATSYMTDRAAIRSQKVGNFEISNNKFYDTYFAIYLEYATQAKILNNVIQGEAREEFSSGNAIHLWYCDGVEVNGNMAENHRDGIYLEFVKNSKIISNDIRHNLRYGLHFMFSNDNSFHSNHFRNNGAGVAVMFSNRISMTGNVFAESWGASSYGMLLKEIYDAEISDNIFSQNSIGIYAEGTARIEYFKNEFSSNGWALKISGGCLENKFYQNNFLSNAFDVSLSGPINDNSFSQNYWSDYKGYDLDKDGIGDVPHRPVKLFNYVVNQTPETVVLLRSLFIDLLNLAEEVTPVFTPDDVLDHSPLIERFHIHDSD